MTLQNPLICCFDMILVLKMISCPQFFDLLVFCVVRKGAFRSGYAIGFGSVANLVVEIHYDVGRRSFLSALFPWRRPDCNQGCGRT